MRQVIFWGAWCCVLASCSSAGESGVDNDKQIKELSAEEVLKLCEWGVPLTNSEDNECDAEVHDTKDESSGSGATDESSGSGPKSDQAEISDGEGSGRSSDIEECKESLSLQFESCDVTVEDLEGCVLAISKNPCAKERDLPECAAMNACGDDDEVINPIIPADGGAGSPWDSCYHESSSAFMEGGCAHQWRCPYGADRSLACELAADQYQCTCRNVKEGVDEGTFTSEDICTLADHNVAYRVNQSCGWQLPEI